MKLAVTFELDETDRLAIADYFGDRGPASRERCADWFSGHARSDLDSLVSDYLAAEESRGLLVNVFAEEEPECICPSFEALRVTGSVRDRNCRAHGKESR